MAKRALLVLSVFVAIMAGCIGVYAQQIEQREKAYLHSSLTAMAHGGSMHDVTLSGSVRVIAGAIDETGTATLKAAPSGLSRIEFNLPTQSQTETSTVGDRGAKGTWKGRDQKIHPIASHNLIAASDWFFPAIIVRRILAPAYVVSFVGIEMRNGVSVAHFSAYMSREGLKPASAAKLLERASQVDLFIDRETLLPTAVCFNAHPDNDAGVDIPVEVRFSGYQAVNGMLVPHHIEKYVNSTLTTDIQVQTVNFNTGLTASSFDAQ